MILMLFNIAMSLEPPTLGNTFDDITYTLFDLLY